MTVYMQPLILYMDSFLDQDKFKAIVWCSHVVMDMESK